MKRHVVIVGMLFLLLNVSAQDYQLSFGVIGQSGTPDSVQVENQQEFTSLKLSGENVLQLVRTISGFNEAALPNNFIKVYPNPFQERANIDLYNPREGSLSVMIFDISGRLIERRDYNMLQGYNSLTVSGLEKGTYVLSIRGKDLDYSALLFSPLSYGKNTDSHLSDNLSHNTATEIHPDLISKGQLKSSSTSGETVQMQYKDGEILILTGYLDERSDEVKLVPTVDTELKFDFSPVAGFFADELVHLAGSLIQFTDTSKNMPLSWEWDFGDGNESTDQNPSYTFNREGAYTISLTAGNKFGSDTETKTGYITVNPVVPQVAFSATPLEISKDESVRFSDQSLNYPTSWLWEFGDGSSSIEENPLHTYTIAGSYSVTLKVSNSAGTDISTKNDYITVNPNIPVAEFTAIPLEITKEESVQFTDQSLNDPESWSWDFGDGSSSTLESPSHTYSLAGTYTVSLIVGNSAGENTETKTDYITVNPFVPVAEFSAASDEITMGESVQFTDQSLNDPEIWSWDFGDGGSSSQENPSHTYEIAGSYTVTLTASNISGSDQEIKTDYITVYPHVPICEFSATPLELSAGGAVQFTDMSVNDPASWSWSFGDGGNSTQENPSHTYSAPGTFTVTLTVTNLAGSDTETKTDYITVNPLTPVTEFSGTPQEIKVGESVQFTDESLNQPSSWSWNFGDGNSSTQENPAHIYTTAGIYSVTLNASNSAGSNAETKTDYITANPRVPVAEFDGSPRTILEGESVQFSDKSTNLPDNWLWDFGDGGSSSHENPSHLYTGVGNYTVTLTAGNSAGSDTEIKTAYITVDYNIPAAEFIGSPRTILEGESVTFTDQSTNVPSNWSWNFGDGNSSSDKNPVHVYATAGTYTVSLTASNATGSDSEIKTDYITVDPDIEGTVSDIDGNTYVTVEIGDQTWMAENLRTTHYADNTAIPHVEGTSAWDALTEVDPAYCWFNNSESPEEEYGILYNWPAAMRGAASTDANPSGVQGVCPAGWHMPSDSEWKELEMYLGMSVAAAASVGSRGTDQGGKLKETGYDHWWEPNTGATNETGFTALPSGFRRSNGEFYGQGIFADLWTATEASTSTTWRRYFPYNFAGIVRNPLEKNYGFSVRCVKD
jgi:uncharacterized protein (TIGR02145 family)